MSDKILLVDDQPEALLLFERVLGSLYSVDAVRSGEAALTALRERGPYAAVVADYNMPRMSGSELLARVQEQSPDTIAILITGQADLDVAIDALHNGRIFRLLEKPCPNAHLVQAVAESVREFKDRSARRVLAEQLTFSRDSLEQFNDALNDLIQEHSRALMRLHRFVEVLNTAETLEAIAELAAECISTVLNGRGSRVALYHAPNGGLVCEASAGERHAGPRHSERALTGEGEIGLVEVDLYDRRSRPLTALHHTLLAAITGSTAVAALNQIRRRERDEAQHATILALAKLAEQRDNETGKHLERVSLFCTLVAEGLREDGHCTDQIDDVFVRDIFRSAPLHDIGKVGIPDSILLKPGKLTPEEWVIMRTHTEIGAETLRAVICDNENQSFLRMSLDIAWCHHEKWDGSGYPRGLAGESIPLCARILALADVYDALTSERVYKSAWTHEKAMALIQQDSGRHFDPRCVEVFVKRQDQAEEIRARLSDDRHALISRARATGKYVDHAA